MAESCLKLDESLLAHVSKNQDIPQPGLPQHLAVTMTLRKGGNFSLLSFSWRAPQGGRTMGYLPPYSWDGGRGSPMVLHKDPSFNPGWNQMRHSCQPSKKGMLAILPGQGNRSPEPGQAVGGRGPPSPLQAHNGSIACVRCLQAPDSGSLTPVQALQEQYIAVSQTLWGCFLGTISTESWTPSLHRPLGVAPHLLML